MGIWMRVVTIDCFIQLSPPRPPLSNFQNTKAIGPRRFPRIPPKPTLMNQKSPSKWTGLIASLFILAGTPWVQAQQTPTVPDTTKMTYNQISQGLDLFVYPSKGQSKSQQKKDEFECYNWAMEQSGIDPLNLPKIEAAPVESGPTGKAVGGAARGAAAGAAIGAITGDAGEGAAVGAVVGGLSGRRAGKAQQAQANQQAQADVAAKEQKMKDDFKKAFSACIEGKGYTIK